MKNIKEWVSYEYDSLSEVAADYDFKNVSDLLHSDLFIYQDQSLSGLLCGVGMDPKELLSLLKRNHIGFATWSIYYLKDHDQYILINNFY